MSTPFRADRLYTPEEFPRNPECDHYELVDGRPVEILSSVLASWVGGQVAFALGRLCDEHGLGYVFASSALYRCFPWRPDLIRKPDGSSAGSG